MPQLRLIDFGGNVSMCLGSDAPLVIEYHTWVNVLSQLYVAFHITLGHSPYFVNFFWRRY